MTDTFTGARPWERPRDRFGWLPFDTYVAQLKANAVRLWEVAGDELDAAVPSCPGWQVSDVLEHVGHVYLHKVACTRLGRAPDPWPPEELADQKPAAVFREGYDQLLDVFATHEPDDPSHTWWPPDKSVGFWMRRMALETAVHRVDVELALGGPTPVDADLALDGIDELLVLMLAGDEWAQHGTAEPVDETVRVTSAGRSWTVVLDARAVTVDRSADGDVAVEVTGRPSDLYLWLWGRAGAATLGITGDDATAAAFRRRLAEAT